MKLVFLLLIVYIANSDARGLKEEFTWSRISYEWPNGRQPPNSIDYNYTTNIPMGANTWNDKIFITVPRRRLGVPSTLNYIRANSTNRHNVPLIPYPNWEINGEGDKSIRFVSIYRVAVDVCDRLWFVDTGLLETLGNPQQIQPPAIVVIDLKTDKILHRHELEATSLRPNGGLASVTIDVTSKTCSDAHAYIPDLSGYGLIVYSLKMDRSWRVTHNFFHLEPTAGDYRIAGHSFQWNDGIFSIALSNTKPDGSRDAYFHSMSGFNEYQVSTNVLKSEELATRSYHENDFKIVGEKGPKGQTSSSDLHQATGIIFLGLVNQNALGCWNKATPMKDLSIVKKDDDKMIYPCDVKVRNNQVIVLTNTMPVFLYGQLDYDRINFRIWMESVSKAVEGTKCAPRRGGGIVFDA